MYRGTSLIRNRLALGPYGRPMLSPKRQEALPPSPPLCPRIGNLVTDGNCGSAGNRFWFPNLAKNPKKPTPSSPTALHRLPAGRMDSRQPLPELSQTRKTATRVSGQGGFL